MRSAKKWILPVLCLVWIAVIWQFSFKPREVSAAESSGVQELLNGTMEKIGAPFRFSGHAVRKTAHFTEYFVLGCLAAASVFSLAGRGKYYLAVPIPVLVAAVDETIQIFVPGRGPAVLDVLLDSGGGLTGILLLSLILEAVLRRKCRKCK